MRVCKRGFECKTRQGSFIYAFLRRLKLGKSLQTGCVNFFYAKADILSEKNTYFGKHLFAKQELTRYYIRAQCDTSSFDPYDPHGKRGALQL